MFEENLRVSGAVATDCGLTPLELSALFRLVNRTGPDRPTAAVLEPGIVGLIKKGLAIEDGGRVRVADFVRLSLVHGDRPKLQYAPAGISVR